MSERGQTGMEHGGPRRTAALAALPPLLLGLAGTLAVVSNWTAVSIAIWGVWASLIVGGGLVALFRRLPRWGYTWLGSALMVIAMSVKLWAEERAETGQPLISPAGDMIVAGLLALALVILVLLAALRGWSQAGAVSIGLASTMGLFTCTLVAVPPFHRRELALAVAPLGLMVSALTFLYERGSFNAARIAILAGIWGVNAGIVWLANQAWQSWLLAQDKPSPALPLLVVLTGLLLMGPVLGMLRQPLRRLLGQAGA